MTAEIRAGPGTFIIVALILAAPLVHYAQSFIEVSEPSASILACKEGCAVGVDISARHSCFLSCVDLLDLNYVSSEISEKSHD